jgi:uncharacterized membrane protein YqhA
MIKNRISAYVFLALGILFLIAAIFSPHEESIMDILFFGLSIVFGAVGINMFKKTRMEKKLRLY